MVAGRPVVLVGAGRYLRERVLPRLTARRPDLIGPTIVTELAGGRREFDETVRPALARTPLTPPRYLPDLATALAAASSPASGIGAGTVPASGTVPVGAAATVSRPAAIVTTPNGLHFAHARACLEGGFDVYVERPVVTPQDDLPELLAIARKRELVFFTGSQRRMEIPYEYIHRAVAQRQGFGRLATVRCLLSTGQRPGGWRVRTELAGGGIVIDSGYHLLDCAAWMLSGCGADSGPVDAAYVHLATASGHDPRDGIEATAFGHVRSEPHEVDVFFDLSYSAPVGSVLEHFSVTDVAGTQVSLTRQQSVRSSRPGRVRHQRADGSVVYHSGDGAPVPLDDTLMSTTSNVAAPLQAFLEMEPDDPGATRHPCSAFQALQTWILTKEIYAAWKAGQRR